MAQCSGPENVSSTVNEAPKKRKVAIITGITGQVTRPASYYSSEPSRQVSGSASDSKGSLGNLSTLSWT